MMNRQHRNNLRRCRQKIVDDLDVYDVLDVLLENAILEEEMYDRILAEQTKKARARRLLDTLSHRGPKAYSVFLEALRTDYSWLADDLDGITEKEDRFNTAEIWANLGEVLMRGGVPQPPAHFISREEEVEIIRNGLRELDCGKFLILHGMPGSGKSVLAGESVRDPSIALNQFPGGVFWVKVGMIESDQLLGRLRALCTKLDSPVLPNDIEEGHEILRKLFLSPPLRDSLLVLDDVWKPEVIRTFSLPVRILVTTQDSSVMDVASGQHTIVGIKPGLTQTEALALFSSYLEVPIEHLPPEALEMYSESKGSPMVISMIAGMLAETGRSQASQRQSGRWTYYLNSLKNRRYSRLKKQRSYDHDSVMGAVQMSIENLSEMHKTMYGQLAVFLDDDPIPSSALEMLWGVEKYEVEDTMTKFIKKSLAMAEFDPVQDCFVYTLHDLQLDYLKNMVTREKERDMHREFVESYFRTVGYRYGDLPDDNYILTHLGYHLAKGEMTDCFPTVFLDLGYVERVVRSCGTACLLNDYRKYGDYIAGPQLEHEETLADFEEFCRTAGVTLCSSSETGIVQLALREGETSAVYIAARRLADQRPENLFLEWKNRSNLHSQNIATILHPGVPTDISFFPDTRVATCTREKAIKIWNVVSGETLQRLHGHRGPITCLAVDPDEPSEKGEVSFCTGCEDGTVKVWRSGPSEDRGEQDQETSLVYRKRSVRKPSPRLSKLAPLNQLFHSMSEEDDSLRTFQYGGQRGQEGGDVEAEEDCEVLAVSWRPGGHGHVAAGGRLCYISVFKYEEEGTGGCEHLRIYGHEEPVNCIRYSADGNYLASGSDDCSVRVWDSSSGQFLGSVNCHELRVLDLSWLGSSHSLATLSSDRIVIWKNPGTGVMLTHLSRNRPTSWTCLAACQMFVAAGTAEDRLVVVWSAASAQVVAALPGHTSPLTSLSFSQEGENLASVSEETLMVWCVEEVETGGQVLSLGPAHHTVWQKGGGKPVTAAPDDLNRITVLEGGIPKHRSCPELSTITYICLNSDCSWVVFGTSEGEVKVFSVETETITQLGQLDGPITCLTVTTTNIVIAGGLDRTVTILPPGTREGTVCQGHGQCVRDLRVVCGETSVLSCDLDGCLRLWSLREQELGREIREIVSAVTPHATCLDTCEEEMGQSLAAVGGVTGGVRIVDLETGILISELARSSKPIRVAKFGPQGKILATGHDSGEVQVWDVNSGIALTQPLQLHSTWVTDLSIAADGSTLLTAGDRLVWWSLVNSSPLTTSGAVNRRRKLSLPLPRSRRTSESKRNSNHEDNLGPALTPNSATSPSNSASCSNTASICGSPTMAATPPSGRKNNSHRFFPTASLSTPHSPMGRRKIAKVGTCGPRALLQTFDLKGSSVNKIFVNEEFSQFVTVDDAGILYILEELIPLTPFIK